MRSHVLIQLAVLGVSAALGAACADRERPQTETPQLRTPGTQTTEEEAAATELGGELEIVTEAGVIVGLLNGATRTFLGVPYVAPPVGALRWAHPRPHEPWAAPRMATTFGSRCPQTDITGLAGGDEDCLTLNVWAPESLAAPAPVMVHIHGGGFTRSSSSVPGRDGRLLSEATGAIVVSFNYRLGAFGFFADPALAAEDSAQPTSGNYGFEDQRAALQWVAANIAAFGGDPGNVTLFGESAGADSISLHMLSPPALGLFHRAILESGDYASLVSSAVSQAQSASLVASAGCASEPSSMACLRSRSTEEVLSAAPATAAWVPAIDGWNIPDCASAPLDTSCIASRVPVILGTNLNEWEFYFAQQGDAPTDDAAYRDMLDGMFGSQAAAIVAEYPSASFASPRKAAADVLTDYEYVCPARRLALTLVGSGLPVFLYSFNHAPVSPMFPGAGAFHASEVAFVFGTSLWGIQLDESERALSRTMMGYWGRMAANGNPNGPDAFAWPQLDSTEASIALDLDLSTTNGWKAERCEFWDTLR